MPFRAVAQYELRAADVAFVTNARWDAVGEGYLPGSPELVIEIISPSNTKNQLREYAALCLANGCKEFWAIDHKQNKVTVTNTEGQSIEYSTGMKLPLTILGDASILVDSIFE